MMCAILLFHQQKKVTKMRHIILIAVTILCLGGCSSQDTITSPQEIVFPETNVKFQNHVLPLIRLTCGVGICHSSSSTIPLTNYTEVVSRVGLVIAKMPSESTLIQFMEGTLPHPGIIDYSYSENHKKGVRTWIMEGALNN